MVVYNMEVAKYIETFRGIDKKFFKKVGLNGDFPQRGTKTTGPQCVGFHYSAITVDEFQEEKKVLEQFTPYKELEFHYY